LQTLTEVVTHQLNKIPIIKGNFDSLPAKVKHFVAEKADLMQPRAIYICDGSECEYKELIGECLETGVLTPLKAYENNYLCRTDPRDVARVESKTWMVTPEKYDSVCHTPEGVKTIMGQWMSPEQFGKELDDRFPGCMAGRTLYVVPFSMGPVGGPLSKIGIELTDSTYVVLCMKIMTRMGDPVLKELHKSGGDFVRCIHSVGQPRPVKTKVINNWPCNPEKTLISHRPAEREIWSFGSGYGGNSLLGKKCFALRIAMNIGYDEGWMAEHMLIMGITSPQGKERFVCAAFPSACGKTNLAMLEPAIPGWKVRVVGDDIAWMKFGADGRLYAINPEAGFFGKVDMIDWLGKPWHLGDPSKAAHPNSRFTAPAGQCPIIHPDWEKPEGVPVDAIIFGGRRPEGVPLVFESRNWVHGIFVGACVKSEATAAAEHAGKQIMHDPMAMRPFMGYNFGRYMRHWMKLGQPPHKVPKIFHVNWFRTTSDGKFLWPGYGDNIRVLDWVLRRCDGDQSIAVESPIGYLPKEGSINLDGLPSVNWAELMSLPKKYWLEDMEETKQFFAQQIGSDLPPEIAKELDDQTERIKAMP
uniref:Phosphoenolpyruvate carboxykinase [GTP] n=1 Tax=Gongylonema pulchrum TaxID=637853 RepID=A0A183DSU8_9BILA